MQNVLPMIEVTTNHWRVPGEDTAIDGWIEGHPHIVPCCRLLMAQHERTALWMRHRVAGLAP